MTNSDEQARQDELQGRVPALVAQGASALFSANAKPQSIQTALKLFSAVGKAVVVETEGLKVWFPIKRGLLRRTVDHVKAVDGLSLKLRQGQTLCVVGVSGSGKT